MRRKIVAGNWKMYKDPAESAVLLRGILEGLGPGDPGATVIVCPPYTSLAPAAEILRGSPVRLGAQNMAEQDEGAFTGEISWKMLKGAGCEYVILGHSERRQFFGESDALVNRKARKALDTGLLPIICVGERLEEREQGVTREVVLAQVKGTLAGMTAPDLAKVTLAYEPVWAIGTGKTATPDQAEEVHAFIRGLVGEMFGAASAASIQIQYGGSVKPDNAADLMRQPDIDGALVGGACLKADSFLSIISAAKSKH